MDILDLPLIEVKFWAGKDDETVGRVIELQTEALCKVVGYPPEAVRVIVHQIPKNHWGIAGKQRSPDLDVRP